MSERDERAEHLRAEFEKWAVFKGLDLRLISNAPLVYFGSETQLAWNASLNAAATAYARGFAEAREPWVELVKALLASDGHALDCRFGSCTCGSVERYKLARAEAVGAIRALEPEE